ncbi:MAG: 4-alpha-glucanotransferase [Opitutaceae bacterium]|nr:4-alpha-glucanotransferase [Cytophagales bacterium]
MTTPQINERSAGILLHITSLPSPFGMGDLGEEAYKFARFLAKSNQKWWQILPLNPTDHGEFPSPYSSNSSMAGNTMLISAELLADEGLLDILDLPKYYLPVTSKANFNEARKLKEVLFEKAYQNFLKEDHFVREQEYEQFCKQEHYWLHDYAIYVSLKHEFNGFSWHHWPEEYKLRNNKSLEKFLAQHKKDIDKTKWLQWVFFRQWKNLRTYCNKINVHFFGDLPFYVSHDSVDVWANPEIFSLDKNGDSIFIAGCPPDYFSEDGQRWGMPVFRWDVLKKQNYDWWIKRLAKNMELYDLLRLDHFMAFSRYWNIDASEETAKNGTWVPGPGEDFFNKLKVAFGSLPFVAEDLGDCDENVYKIRDSFGLPGMKILQFGFGSSEADAIHKPHNYGYNFIVYAGNHDNNTTRGWYSKEAGKHDHKRLKKYTGIRVTEKNVAEVLGKMVYASVCKIAILTMQDILNLDETFRMNTPGTMENNWTWRLENDQITKSVQRKLKAWTKLYDRISVLKK